jgi:cytokinin riboside 5'-monophosphate phosphoribohydrolase
MNSICVFCSSSNKLDDSFFKIANELGKAIALNQYVLVYGGSNVGLMGELAKSVHHSSGRVIGVIPEVIKDKDLGYLEADELIITKDLRERKHIMSEKADAYIALPGGFGTLEEILEVITLKQLEFHNKPIVFLNTNSFYSKLLDFFEVMYNQHFAKESSKQFYYIADNVEDAMDYIKNYKAPKVETKWFNVGIREVN